VTAADHGDEHFVRRLEAFSDIVIGFTLAQIGATLVLPGHPADLVANLWWLFTFVWTFAVVCLMWWLHNRLFRTVFVPTPASVVANFGLLAAIVLLVYLAEVMAHSATLADVVVAQRMYDVALSIACALIAVLTRSGVQHRGDTIDPDVATRAARTTVVNTGAAVVLLVAVAMTFFAPLYMWSPMILGLGIPFGFFCGRMAAARFGAPR
jgi:uncharacterized membrane protein